MASGGSGGGGSGTTTVRAAISGFFGRYHPWPLFGVAALLPTAFFVYYTLPVDRFFVVSAETDGVTLTFRGGPFSGWSVGDATVCVPRPLDAEAPTDAPSIRQCSGAIYEVLPAALEFEWPRDSRARLTLDPDRTLVVQVDAARTPVEVGDDLPRLPEAGRIVVTADALRQAGSLRFAGEVSIGEVPGAGRRGLLRSGRFLARELLGGDNQATTVLEGTFLPGDRVSFASDRDDAVVEGYGTIRLAPEPWGGLEVLAISAPGRSHLSVARIGSEIDVRTGAANRVRPSWLDRFRNDPRQLAGVALLGLAAGFLGMISTVLGLFRRPE